MISAKEILDVLEQNNFVLHLIVKHHMSSGVVNDFWVEGYSRKVFIGEEVNDEPKYGFFICKKQDTDTITVKGVIQKAKDCGLIKVYNKPVVLGRIKRDLNKMLLKKLSEMVLDSI